MTLVGLQKQHYAAIDALAQRSENLRKVNGTKWNIISPTTVEQTKTFATIVHNLLDPPSVAAEGKM